ncbi:hypothetical protein [Sporolactobacillus laevolacticus]|uniref:hypothetical protein n=1 Tax=Sporolactobacillus laevolacticus TaxID=33018 RepID=UPI0025B5968A|nr:hypothetical protein [Sporolactobacillus laevolacticus]MDN3954538.1 hypothetical protein [Sporolactobacillus laevolacticus]
MEGINENWEEYFINIADKDKLTKISSMFDLDYLGGAIFLKYGNKVILDFKLWDYVDQLWAYIISLIEDFILKGNSETFFPDQPIKIGFNHMSHEFMTIEIEASTLFSWQVPKQEFLMILLQSGETFFEALTENLKLNDDHYSPELEKIQQLKEKVRQIES